MWARTRNVGIFVILAAFVTALGGCGLMGSKENVCLEYRLIDKAGKPTRPLLELLDVVGTEHDGTFRGVVEATQAQWLRPAGKERWEVEIKHEEKRDDIMPVLEKIGCTQEVHPSQQQYTYGVVLGALVSRVRSRFAHLLKQWEKGIRFDEVVFLGGERPLHPKLEAAEILLDPNNKELPFSSDWQLQGELPKTETEMMKMVFDQAKLPEGFAEAVRVTFVDAPMKQKADGTLVRPNTGDTVNKWLEQNPVAGSCLFFSNQPYTGRQHSVALTYMPERFSIETVGGAAYEDLPIVTFLDSLARWLYQEKKRRFQNICPQSPPAQGR